MIGDGDDPTVGQGDLVEGGDTLEERRAVGHRAHQAAGLGPREHHYRSAARGEHVDPLVRARVGVVDPGPGGDAAATAHEQVDAATALGDRGLCRPRREPPRPLRRGLQVSQRREHRVGGVEEPGDLSRRRA
jgi:hypothetical protein